MLQPFSRVQGSTSDEFCVRASEKNNVLNMLEIRDDGGFCTKSMFLVAVTHALEHNDIGPGIVTKLLSLGAVLQHRTQDLRVMTLRVHK